MNRYITLVNPTTENKHKLNLEGLWIWNAARPLDLPDGSNPYYAHSRQEDGGPVEFPAWLPKLDGLPIKDEQVGHWHAISPREQRGHRSAVYTIAERPEAFLDLFRKKGADAGFEVMIDTVIQGRPLLALVNADRAGVNISSDGKSRLAVSYSGIRTGRFPFNDPFPHLEFDRFDNEEQTLYLLDPPTGQRFSLGIDVVEAEDELRY